MIQDLNNQIKEICGNAYRPLEKVHKNGFKKHYEFEIDLSSLRDFSNEDIRYSVEHSEKFDKLKSMTGPVVYWFEFVSEVDSYALVELFKEYKDKPGRKAIPALKVQPSHGTTVLYVGKVKTQFWGRVIQHLGFYKVQGTQGLQLYHWARPLGLKLKVHALEFEPEMENLMPIIENGVAAELKPLLGKHR
jgi:hypothetical protein